MDILVSPRNNSRLRNRGKSIRHPKQKQIITRNCKNGKNSTVKSNIFRNGHKDMIFKSKKSLKGAQCKKTLNNNGQEHKDPVIGEFTRQVYDAICTQLKGNNPLHIPEDNVLNILNQLQVYPSKSQVSKILQYAKRCNRNGAANGYLTFGEFCMLIREMQNQKSPIQIRKPSITNNKNPTKYQVFLGGSCNPTTWRADTAIPELQKHGISYYNPQVTMWAPELVEQEYDAKQAALLLLFVIDSQTRSTVGMIEVAYLVASGRCVVVVAQPYAKGQSIMGEVVSDEEYYDLVSGQTCLVQLVKSKGVKIHEDLSSALNCTAKYFDSKSSPEQQIAQKLSKLEEEYKSCKGSIDVNKILDIHERLTNRRPDPSKVENYLRKTEINGTITFDQFLTLMAEIDGCDMCTMRMNTSNNNSCDPVNPRWMCNGESSVNNVATNVSYNHDVFLGGSFKTAMKWRKEYIPLFENQGISYYNPTIRERGSIMDDKEMGANETSLEDNIIQEWKVAIDNSRIKLFIITNDTRSLTSMVLAAYCLAIKPDSVVLCVQHLPDGCVINNETLTKNAIKDYNRARVYLTDLAKRKQVKVFNTIKDAVQEAIEKSKKR